MRFFYLLISLVLLTVTFAEAQISAKTNDGINWQKTLRIRGVMEPLDPFNESKLYQLSEIDVNQINVDKKFVQIAQIASNFWMVMRDSLIQAIKKNQIDVYLLEENPIHKNVFEKSVKIGSYNILINELYDNVTAYQRRLGRSPAEILSIRNANRSTQPFVRVSIQPASMLEEFFIMYELEIQMTVDETGFKIDPLSLIIGTLVTANPQRDPAVLANPLVSGLFYDIYQEGVGFIVDLKEPKTYNYLVEHGIKFSGENNIIPYYDLLTMFHYDFVVFSESDNVLATNAVAFGYSLEQLQAMLQNRYNEITFNYLYGQPPQWWENYAKGGYTNGLFEIPEGFEPATEGNKEN